MRTSIACLCLSAALISMTSVASGEISLSEKHLIVLRAGLDSVWGDYIFSVQNHQQEPQQTNITLFIPRETVDFSAVEGVSAADLRLDAKQGRVIMSKQFPEGATLVNVAFKVDAQDGVASLNWVAAHALQSVNVMYEHDIIEVTSDKLEATQLPRISDTHYRALHTTQALQAGDGLQVQVQGIPQGRARLHLFAVVFAAILLVSALILGMRTRPRLNEETKP